MAAALAAHEKGVRDILLLERDQYLGGILNQCIHTGFGLSYFKEILTGPEYAERFIRRIDTVDSIEVSFKSLVTRLTENKEIVYFKPGRLERLRAKAVIVATGSRERTREMVHVPGTRPAGVMTAGLAQKLINIEGLLPGEAAVIIGSGDIGLIMARRLALEGVKVQGIIEIQQRPAGLMRNVVQCAEDFGVPFYLGHKVARIYGRNRVEGVEAAKVDERFCEIDETRFSLSCDTVLVSAGLIPENELMEAAGVLLDEKTNTPVSDGPSRTSVAGIFACGNASKIYDIVDTLSCDAAAAGGLAAAYLLES